MHLVPSYGKGLTNVLEVRQSWYEERAGKMSDTYHRKPMVSLLLGMYVVKRCPEPVWLFFSVTVPSSKCILHQIGGCHKISFFSFFCSPKKYVLNVKGLNLSPSVHANTEPLGVIITSAECRRTPKLSIKHFEEICHTSATSDILRIGLQVLMGLKCIETPSWLVVSPPLKNISQLGWLYINNISSQDLFALGFEAEAFLTERHPTWAPLFSR